MDNFFKNAWRAKVLYNRLQRDIGILKLKGKKVHYPWLGKTTKLQGQRIYCILIFLIKKSIGVQRQKNK